MKKVVSLILALITLLFCLTACGTDKYKDYHATNMEAKTFTTYYDDLIFEADTLNLYLSALIFTLIVSYTAFAILLAVNLFQIS